MKINVTPDDIRYGARGDCKRCPIARAIDRLLVSTYFAEVADEIRIRKKVSKHLVAKCNIPESAVAFMSRFDGGEYAPPFEFELLNLSPALFA